MALFPVCRLFAQRSQDAEQLGRAIEYFSSAKYHEALLILDRLNKQYTLNPRYLAYLGVCHYYEWNYAEAIQYLDKAIPQLSAFSPHERSFYYWSNAESHFLLGRYDEAIPLYEKMLNLCYENEKADAFYRLGFCHMFAEDWQKACDNYKQAAHYYTYYRPEEQARLVQINNMIAGCEKHIPQPTIPSLSAEIADTIATKIVASSTTSAHTGSRKMLYEAVQRMLASTKLNGIKSFTESKQ